MQKSGVKTLSIIDTLSQVAREEPQQIMLIKESTTASSNKSVQKSNSAKSSGSSSAQQQPPQLQKRSPKVRQRSSENKCLPHFALCVDSS